MPESTSWSKEDFATPEGQAVFDAVFAQTVADQFERLRHFARTAENWDQEWQRAAVSNQSYLFLTAEELRELVGEVRGVAERWAEVSQRARDAGDTEAREPVLTFFHAFPEHA